MFYGKLVCQASFFFLKFYTLTYFLSASILAGGFDWPSAISSSPISDFSSDYDDDDIANGQSKPPSSMEADKK